MVPTEDTMDPRRRFGRRSGRTSTGSPPDPPPPPRPPPPRPPPARPAPAGSPVPGRLLTVEDRCWQCRSKVRAIVGVLVDPALTTDKHGFVPFEAVAPQLASALDSRTLAARRIGDLRHRESPGVPG